MSYLPASDPAKSRVPWILGAAAAAAVLVGVGVGVMKWERFADLPVADVPPPLLSASVLAGATPDLDLATSTQADRDHAPEAVTVLVTRKQLLIGGDALPVATFPEGLRVLAPAGLPANYKRSGPNDLFLPDLGNGLTFWRTAAQASARARGAEENDLAVAVLADASTPYRVLMEVLFTAGQSELGRFDLAVRAADGSLQWLVSRAPTMPSRALDPRALALSIFVTDAGFSVHARGGNLAPGCDGVGPGVTMPKIAEAYDHRGLTACLRKIKDFVPEAKDETEVTLTAAPAIEFQTIVSTMDTLKGTAETGPLFPTIHFGVSRDDTAAAAKDTSDRRGGLLGLDDRRGGGGDAISAEASKTDKVKAIGLASIGGAAVAGGSIANASAVVAGMAAGFRRCYTKGLQEDPKLRGSVRLTAKIGRDGEVLSVSPAGGSGLSGTVISCVSSRVSSAQFAPPDGGGATVVIPVTFTPQ
jgi:biopolymer transport protein ExbD